MGGVKRGGAVEAIDEEGRRAECGRVAVGLSMSGVSMEAG